MWQQSSTYFEKKNEKSENFDRAWKNIWKKKFTVFSDNFYEL